MMEHIWIAKALLPCLGIFNLFMRFLIGTQKFQSSSDQRLSGLGLIKNVHLKDAKTTLSKIVFFLSNVSVLVLMALITFNFFS